MVNAQSRKVAFLFSFVIFGLFAVESVRVFRALSSQTSAQEKVTESLQRWKSSYLALADSRTKWDKNYRREASVQDIASLFSYVGLGSYGLTSDSDNLVLTKVEQVVANGSPIGITKICMATGTGDGGYLLVQSANYQSLMLGIEKLASRSDIYLGNITVQGDKQVPIAKLGDFCILLRND